MFHEKDDWIDVTYSSLEYIFHYVDIHLTLCKSYKVI